MATNGVKTEDQNGDSKKMGFFDSVLAPPEWLTEGYMENALREYEKDDDLKITRYAITTCTKPGDNFVGVIFRAIISFTTRGSARDESFIVKVEPFLEGFKKDVMTSQPFFKTEGRMYTEMLPVMQELLKNSGDPEIIAPGLIHYNTDPKILVFQDLTPENFVMQHMPVGFEKASLVAKKLGKFHALSWYLNYQQPEDNLLKSFRDGFFSEKLMKNWDFIITNMNALCELTQEWGMDLVAEKLKALRPHFVEKLMKVYLPNPTGLSILNHGDFHIRNLLFRYDQQDPSTYDAIYCIDFQLSVYATPAIDLTYLLYMITDNDARDNHRDQLLKTYHDQFTATLKGLGHLGTIPSLLDFHVELLKNGVVEFFIAVNFLTLFYMDHSKMAVTDFSDKDALHQMVREMFEGPVFKPLLQRILPQFMCKGFLDV